MIFLSYLLDQKTPSYGDRNTFEITKKSDMLNGDIANDSFISTTVHIGTHIDMPYHFYNDGQTIEDFDADFWIFNKPLLISIEPQSLLIKNELIERLDTLADEGFDLLIVRTGICDIRDEQRYWSENYGFHPDIYDYIVRKFPSVRVFGFDSISVSGITDRLAGREAHKRFLNPKKPILLLEDMDLRDFDKISAIKKIIVAPLRISQCDGLPCTIFGLFND
jgi:kynurenine formamidase